MRQYEAMFLFDSTVANESGKADAEIERILGRAGAEIIVSKKWDERKLAYEINRRKRGCYMLTYFRSETDRIAGIERDVDLSESVLRVIVLRVDDISRARMESMYPVAPTATKPPASTESSPVVPTATKPPAGTESSESSPPVPTSTTESAPTTAVATEDNSSTKPADESETGPSDAADD